MPEPITLARLMPHRLRSLLPVSHPFSGWAVRFLLLSALILPAPVVSAPAVDNVPAGVSLQVRGLLQGAYERDTALMRDELRRRGLIPARQPYGSGTLSLEYDGPETLDPALLALEGADAPVDWVLVELRNPDNVFERLAGYASVLQRDGDVADALSNDRVLHFPALAPGSYYVALRHRNHLGVMTAAPVALSGTAVSVDFSAPDTALYGSEAEVVLDNVPMLWAGDGNGDDAVISAGFGSDINTIYGTILISDQNVLINNNFVLNGYYPTDLNLDGRVIAFGPENDSVLVIGNVLRHPRNLFQAMNYVVDGGIP
ncbi:MAG: hypothetical protein KDI44_13570 [Thiothrix sp.]|nr:hypothetical protein [Thiothrix sp.]